MRVWKYDLVGQGKWLNFSRIVWSLFLLYLCIDSEGAVRLAYTFLLWFYLIITRLEDVDVDLETRLLALEGRLNFIEETWRQESENEDVDEDEET